MSNFDRTGDYILTVRRLALHTIGSDFYVNVSHDMAVTNQYLKIGDLIFKTQGSFEVGSDEIYLGYFHRRQLKVGLGDQIRAQRFECTSDFPLVAKSVIFEVDTLRKVDSSAYQTVIDSKLLTETISKRLDSQILVFRQKVALDYNGLQLILTCLEHEPDQFFCLIDTSTEVSLKRSRNLMVKMNLSKKPSRIWQSGAAGSGHHKVPWQSGAGPWQSGAGPWHSGATGPLKTTTPKPGLIDENYDLEKLGIGGLDQQFNQIFRRAFISRIYPSDVVRQCGIKHVKGIILHGPSGTGKTLLARQIGKMLNCQEVTVINGPELLNRFVGQSEENIRQLFANAEADYQKYGDESALHLIILDEMDALCKRRGTHQGVAVHDSIVNQLLSKMDGVNSLNNILLIGMTNRLDMLDGALLRPGRFEIQIEINLPDPEGRLTILNIHTRDLVENKLLDQSVNITDVSRKTENFTGAELEGLVKNAVSYALDRSLASKRENDNKSRGPRLNSIDLQQNDIKVCEEDFANAMDEIHPAFGSSQSVDRLANLYLPYGLTNYGPVWDHISNQIDILVAKLKSANAGKFTVLLRGGAEVGKTALAVYMAIQADFPFVRLVSAMDMIGMTELEKCNYLTEIFNDATKSKASVIILDDLERIIEYAELGPRYSNNLLQTVISLTKRATEDNRKLMIIGTAEQGIIQLFPVLNRTFQVNLDIPYLDRTGLNMVVDGSEIMLDHIHMTGQLVNCLSAKKIGIKKLYEIIEIVDNNERISNCQNLMDIIEALTGN